MKRGDKISVRVGDDTWYGCEVVERDVAQGVLFRTPGGREQWADVLDCTPVPKNPVFETMTKVKLGNWTIRVWREEPGFQMGADAEIQATIQKLAVKPMPSEIVHAVGALPRVAAIEIINEFGNGGIFYPDWK